MTEFSKIGIARTSSSKWYFGPGNPLQMGLKVDHIHVLPLGFSRLAVMQAGRCWQGGSTTSIGVELQEEDR